MILKKAFFDFEKGILGKVIQRTRFDSKDQSQFTSNGVVNRHNGPNLTHMKYSRTEQLKKDLILREMT